MNALLAGFLGTTIFKVVVLGVSGAGLLTVAQVLLAYQWDRYRTMRKIERDDEQVYTDANMTVHWYRRSDPSTWPQELREHKHV